MPEHTRGDGHDSWKNGAETAPHERTRAEADPELAWESCYEQSADTAPHDRNVEYLVLAQYGTLERLST